MNSDLPCAVKHQRNSEHKTSHWSGGFTTELAIYPPEANYADRDFTVRVSSATVENDMSEFTPLPGFTRHIMPLDDQITLLHENKDEITLSPYDAHTFDGAWRTISKGRCTDFNLMLKYGIEGDIKALSGRETHTCEPGGLLLFYCLAPCSVSVPSLNAAYELQPGDTLSFSECREAIELTVNGGEGRVCGVAAGCELRRELSGDRHTA
jgi:environmental stress-induced protein Ves